MPIKIDGSNSNVSIHQHFWNALTSNSDSLALSQLWLCGFDMKQLSTVGNQIASKLNNYEQNTWSDNQTKVNNCVLDPVNFDGVSKSAGSIYLFTQGISFIADGINTSRVGSSQVGATKGLIGDSRLDLNASNITFLESNVSFVDGFLRPWSILVGHRSLKDPLLRCDISLFALEKWSLFEPLKIRKAMLFKNAVPINIDAEEYNYTGDKLIERQVQFAFDRYEMRVYPETSNADIVGALKNPADMGSLNYFTLTPNIPQGYAPGQVQIPVPMSPAIDLNHLTDLGTKQYYAEVTTPASKKSLLDTLKGALGTATATLARAQGAASEVSSKVAQGLQAVGMNSTANQVSQLGQDFRSNLISPAANIIGTGQGAIGGYQSAAMALSNASNTKFVGSYNSDQVSQNAINQASKLTTTDSVPNKGQEITLMETTDATPAPRS